MIKDRKDETAEGQNAPQMMTVLVQIPSKDHADMVNHFQNAFTGGFSAIGRPLVAVNKIVNPDEEPLWMLDTDMELVLRRIDDDTCYVRELNGARSCVLHITPEGRLTFNGVDIETEQFMAYLGVMDEVICVNEVK